MGGRADVYVGFFERALRSLKPGGRLAFICADRWMRNQYGSTLREFVGRDCSVDCVWTMHDVDAFEQAVAAYPAITVLSKNKQPSAVVADTTSLFGEQAAKRLANWTVCDSSLTLREELGEPRKTVFEAFRLPHWFPGDEMWPSANPARLALLEYLADNFKTLDDPQSGVRVGIGVATGADKVYVTEDESLVESDRLLRLAMVADTKTANFKWSGKYLVDPWSTDGHLVELDGYPRLNRYFNQNSAVLRARHTARSKPHQWYRTIDKVNRSLVDVEKLVIPDMKTSINPVLVPKGYYPHHNLYYMTSANWDLRALGGLLLSRICQAFIEAYCVRMRGNTLRFQAQYLKKIRIPDFELVDSGVKKALRDAFDANDVEAATRAARIAYALPGEIYV